MASLVRPDPSEWPRFILDMGEKPTDTWTIREFAKCVDQIWDPKIGFRYGAISYAWGNWHDKRNFIDGTKDTRYPAFDSSIKQTWKFPVVNNHMDKDRNYLDPVDPIFTIDDVKKTLSYFKLRWVWWDWACIPQGKWVELEAQTIDATPTGQNLNLVQSLEVEKMRFVYPRSLAGCLWLHQSVWVTSGTKGPVQNVLDYIKGTRSKSAAAQISVPVVKNFLDLLVETRKQNLSFQSVWSFQEGVLLNDSMRPYDSHSKNCVLLDHNGVDYRADEFFSGTADLTKEMVATASAYLTEITTAIRLRAFNKAPDTSTFSPWKKWIYDPTNDAETRTLLSRLLETGLVGYTYNNPIPLFESKFSRKAPWMSELDLCVNAVVGAMDVGIAKDIVENGNTAKKDKLKSLLASNPTATDDEKKKFEGDASKAELAILKPAFLTSMVQTYQWRMLLLARGNPASPSTTAWWPTFVELKRPRFASLEYYLGSVKLATMYQPRKPVPSELPKGMYNLPQLEVGTTDARPLVVKPKSGYLAYDLSKSGARGWTSCMFYEYLDGPAPVSPDTDPTPGTVGFIKLDWSDKPKMESKLGKNLLILPLEDVRDPDATRCVILSDYVPKDAKATFRGIGDFVGLSSADSIEIVKSGALEIW